MMLEAKQLRELRYIDDRVQAKLREVDRLRATIERVSPPIVADKVQSSAPTDKISETIAKIVDLQAEINADIDRLIALKRKTMRQIDAIKDDRYRLLLTLRYVNGYTFKRMSEIMHYDPSWLATMHRNYIREIDVG